MQETQKESTLAQSGDKQNGRAMVIRAAAFNPNRNNQL
jgi:hypothetical protein